MLSDRKIASRFLAEILLGKYPLEIPHEMEIIFSRLTAILIK
jgi:hypothetical protein